MENDKWKQIKSEGENWTPTPPIRSHCNKGTWGLVLYSVKCKMSCVNMAALWMKPVFVLSLRESVTEPEQLP